MLMMFSRPIAPGFRRKNLDGCHVVGQWIVPPEERRIQKEGRVVGMASNIIDALVCLIEAKGLATSCRTRRTHDQGRKSSFGPLVSNQDDDI